jgi:death-on-curing family protein
MVFPTAEDLTLFYHSLVQEGLEDHLPLMSDGWAERTERIVQTVRLAQYFSAPHRDVYYCAADILYKVCKNHVHPDGNKRTAILASALFLLGNDIRLNIPSNTLYEQVKSVACDGRDQAVVIAEIANEWRASQR